MKTIRIIVIVILGILCLMLSTCNNTDQGASSKAPSGSSEINNNGTQVNIGSSNSDGTSSVKLDPNVRDALKNAWEREGGIDSGIILEDYIKTKYESLKKRWIETGGPDGGLSLNDFIIGMLEQEGYPG